MILISCRLCYALHAERSDFLDARANTPYENSSTTNCEPSEDPWEGVSDDFILL